MVDNCRTWLEDIRIAIEEINSFVSIASGFSAFQNDIRTRKAVERNIEIIGEAMDRILKAEPNITITDSRKIVNTRNRIIHGYESVSPDVIWLIIERYLPLLLLEVKALLEKQ